jgi:glycosyltransferase involved in cell wall biosynthesis
MTGEMSSGGLVTILMNCYNGEKYLRQAIESVLSQTYQNWEIVFWDDQSTDRSAEIFNSYSDPRLRYFYAPKRTWLYGARSLAMENARGDFIAFLDVDDWWLPTKLEKQVPLFNDPDVGFACGNFWVENEMKSKRWKFHSRRMPTGWVLDKLLASQIIGLVTLMIRRSALDSLQYAFDPRYHILGDTDLALRLSVRWKMDCVQEPIAYYRLHEANITKNGDRLVDEMRTWISDMQQIDPIRASPSWPVLEQRFVYMRAVYELLDGRRNAAFRLTRQLPWGKMRAKLSLAALLPSSVVRRLKN